MQQALDGSTRQQAQSIVETCLGRRVARLHRLVNRRFEAELRPLGLTLPQLEILSELALSGSPTRPSDIAGQLGLERSTMSRSLDVLAQHDLVRAAATSATGRTTQVAITEAGCQVLANTEAAWHRAQTWLGQALGPGATTTLDQWLARLGAQSATASTTGR